jgi:hypothetical protein
MGDPLTAAQVFQAAGTDPKVFARFLQVEGGVRRRLIGPDMNENTPQLSEKDRDAANLLVTLS